MKLTTVFIFIAVIFSVNQPLTGRELESFPGLDSSWNVRDVEGGSIYTRTLKKGKVPVLCFHKINNEERYGLTPEAFRDLLIFLKENRFYVISDKQFINTDYSEVPTGYRPIVLGADDASEGNFIYKAKEGVILRDENGKPEIDPLSMTGLLDTHLGKENGQGNFTFYISLDKIPFRQTGGISSYGPHYRGIPVVQEKLMYLRENYIIGIHTVTHPVTKNSSVEDFQWELKEFYTIMEEYLGEGIRDITTLAYPYGCGDLKPELEKMIREFEYKGVKIAGAFDFDGYFSPSPDTGLVNMYEISRLGVDNKNIKKVFWFLENVVLYENERVIVIDNPDDLNRWTLQPGDRIYKRAES